MKAEKMNKIKDWFVITRIRILNFIKEHKYISAGIGVFLISIIVALVVRAADETIDSIPVSVTGEKRGISIKTSEEIADETIAPNFTNVIYSLGYYLGEGDNRCSSQEDNSSYKVDEVVIEATIPLNDNIKWAGSDETAISEIINDTDNNASTLKITVPLVNACSAHNQIFTLSVLNAEKNTEISPQIKIKGGSHGPEQIIDQSTFSKIKTSYDKTKDLVPLVRPGVARKISNTSNDRDVMFGILLGVNSDSSSDTISLKNTYLKTSADITLMATQGSSNESITLYTNNTTNFNGNHDGNYYGINNSSRHFFTSGVMPDLTSTSGKINGLTKIDALNATYGIQDSTVIAPVVTLTGDTNLEIEKYPVSESYRNSIRTGALSDVNVSVAGASSVESTDEIYDGNGNKIDINDIDLNTKGTYEVRIIVPGSNNSKTTMIRKVNIVDPSNSNYSLEGAKTMYATINSSTFKELGIYNTSTSSKATKGTDYNIEYYNGDTKLDNKEAMLSSVGTYTQKYINPTTNETLAQRTIKVVNSLPTITSEKIAVKTANLYNGETLNSHKLFINDTEIECNGRCSVKQENQSYIYTINKKNSDSYITEITKNVNIIPTQYKLSISNIMPNSTATRVDNNFYAVGAYYVTAKSTRASGTTDKIDVNLKAIVGASEHSGKVENKTFASGEDTSSLSNKMYVNESLETVEVTANEKNGLNGNYFTAAMGEVVTMVSTFEYGYDADENIPELNFRIPVNGNLIPTAATEEIISTSSYFLYEIKYNGQKVSEIPNYEIKYYDSNNTAINPENFDSENQVISYINIKIKSTEDKTFEIKPGTSIELKTKFKVRTFSGTSDVANDVSNLKFNGDVVVSWKVNDQTYSKEQSTPEVYVTPYKIRTTVGIGRNDNYSTTKDITLDASKNENYTVYALTNVISPAMNITSNIFGYSKISRIPIIFELPAGVNYVYNKDYELEPAISYRDGKTILTYTYESVEPNSWIEPIYFDFNVDVATLTGNFIIDVLSGDLTTNNYKITNDVSSIDKYKKINKNIAIVNVEDVSYGQYIYSNGQYASNIDASTEDKVFDFDFSTKLHNNKDHNIENINVYTVLPYIDTEKESSFNGTYEIANLPTNALCTTSEPSMVTKSELVGQVNWQSCSDFKKSNNKYSGFTAFKVMYDRLSPNENKETTIKIYPIGNKPNDVYTFKSYLQYTGSDYKSFEDINLEVISKKITGVVWEDFNVDGIMDDNEKKISNVNLKLYDSSDNLIKSTTPNKDGRYTFEGISIGNYYIVADFNTDKYGITGNPSEDFYDKTRLSVFNAVEISDDEELDDEEELPKYIVKTNEITIGRETRIVRNMNLGLSLKKLFGIKVNKYITRAEVTNALGIVTTKNYGNTKLAKLDVKDINNLSIKVVYTIEIENIKYYPGYATLVTELIPDGMSFNSEYKENEGWELSEEGLLTNKTLADQLINEGEKKYLTIAFDITRKEAGSFINFASVDELQILGGISDEE